MTKMTMMCMDAWTFIPLMIIMLLAGLQGKEEEEVSGGVLDGGSDDCVDWFCDRHDVNATDDVIDFVVDAHFAFHGE